MKLKKRLFILMPILVIILLLVIGSLFKNTFVSLYLHNKYDMSFSQIDIINYEKSHFDFDYGLDSSNSTTFFPKKWTVKYNEKTFIVQGYRLHFVDDYQLEDLDSLITRKLQTEIDKNITHIFISSDMIYHSPQYNFNYKLPYSDHKTWTESNKIQFFENILDNENISVFYFVNNIDEYVGTKKTYMNYGNKKYEILKKRIENDFKKQYGYNKKITLVMYDSKECYGRYAWGELFGCPYKQIGLSPIEMNNYPLNVVMKGEEK